VLSPLRRHGQGHKERFLKLTTAKVIAADMKVRIRTPNRVGEKQRAIGTKEVWASKEVLFE
jgi:hypothetical protein